MRRGFQLSACTRARGFPRRVFFILPCLAGEQNGAGAYNEATLAFCFWVLVFRESKGKRKRKTFWPLLIG